MTQRHDSKWESYHTWVTPYRVAAGRCPRLTGRGSAADGGRFPPLLLRAQRSRWRSPLCGALVRERWTGGAWAPYQCDAVAQQLGRGIKDKLLHVEQIWSCYLVCGILCTYASLPMLHFATSFRQFIQIQFSIGEHSHICSYHINVLNLTTTSCPYSLEERHQSIVIKFLHNSYLPTCCFFYDHTCSYIKLNDIKLILDYRVNITHSSIRHWR